LATTRRGYAYPIIGRLPVAAIDTGLDTMFENALSYIAAPQAKKAALEKVGTLNARGVAEALRRDLGKAVVPELRRIRQTVNERRTGLAILA